MGFAVGSPDDWPDRADVWWPRDMADDGPVRCESCGRIGGPTLDGRCMPGKGCNGFGGAHRVIGEPGDAV